MTHTRSFLKWAGNKYNCLQNILNVLPIGNRLIEPFVGSGCVFINTNYKEYLLGEQNKDLIQLFMMLKTKKDTFIEYCSQFFKPEYNTAESYYNLREEFNQLQISQKRAALFLYLNKHGYNGLCRYNSKGGFNVPFGLYSNPQLPSFCMQKFYEKSQQATFVHADFKETFSQAKIGDVIYCDPPYVPISQNKRSFNYTAELFTLEDQIILAELAQQTAAKGIPVIISNHDTPFTRLYYKNADIKSFNVSRTISCDANNRIPVKELIAIFT